MNLKNDIEIELWNMIQKNYENESYSSAILDAMHFLTETIRNKTGLEGDGTSLVGQALGGDNPKIQLNKLQTESEKNIQKGIQEILRGLYTAIRNPRSHDKHIDSKKDADSIIYFISYLLNIIDKSKLSFEESTYLRRVFDEHYVKTEKYSELLVKEIPKRQKTNIAISIIRRRAEGDINSLRSFMSALFEQLDDNELSQIYKVISEELKYTRSHEEIRTILHMCTAKHWNRIEKVVKIRIENFILENVKSCRCSALGTWVEYEHMQNFEDIEDWTYLLVSKVESNDIEEKNYVDKYFWDKICKLNHDNIHFSLKYYFKTGLKNKDEEAIKKLKSIITCEKNHPWWKVFKEELKEYPDIIYEDFDFDDDIPF